MPDVTDVYDAQEQVYLDMDNAPEEPPWDNSTLTVDKYRAKQFLSSLNAAEVIASLDARRLWSSGADYRAAFLGES